MQFNTVFGAVSAIYFDLLMSVCCVITFPSQFGLEGREKKSGKKNQNFIFVLIWNETICWNVLITCRMDIPYITHLLKKKKKKKWNLSIKSYLRANNCGIFQKLFSIRKSIRCLSHLYMRLEQPLDQGQAKYSPPGNLIWPVGAYQLYPTQPARLAPALVGRWAQPALWAGLLLPQLQPLGDLFSFPGVQWLLISLL